MEPMSSNTEKTHVDHGQAGQEVCRRFRQISKQHRNNVLALLRDSLQQADYVAVAAAAAALLGAQDPRHATIHRDAESVKRHAHFTEAFDATFEILRRQPMSSGQVERQMRRMQQCAITWEEKELRIVEHVTWLMERGEYEFGYDVLTTPLRKATTNSAIHLPPGAHRQAYAALLKHRQWLEHMQRARKQCSSTAPGAGRGRLRATLQGGGGEEGQGGGEEGAALDPHPDSFVHRPRVWGWAMGQRRVMEDARKAEDHLREALQQRPQATLLVWLLAQLHMTAGRPAAARRAAAAAAIAAPSDAGAQMLAALMHRVGGDGGVGDDDQDLLDDGLRYDDVEGAAQADEGRWDSRQELGRDSQRDSATAGNRGAATAAAAAAAPAVLDPVEAQLMLLRINGGCRPALEGLLQSANLSLRAAAAAAYGCLLVLDDCGTEGGTAGGTAAAASAGGTADWASYVWGQLAFLTSSMARAACDVLSLGVPKAAGPISHDSLLLQPSVGGSYQAVPPNAASAPGVSTNTARPGHAAAQSHKPSSISHRAVQSAASSLDPSHSGSQVEPPPTSLRELFSSSFRTARQLADGLTVHPSATPAPPTSIDQVGSPAAAAPPGPFHSPHHVGPPPVTLPEPLELWLLLQGDLRDRGYWWVVTHMPTHALPRLPRLRLDDEGQTNRRDGDGPSGCGTEHGPGGTGETGRVAPPGGASETRDVAPERRGSTKGGRKSARRAHEGRGGDDEAGPSTAAPCEPVHDAHDAPREPLHGAPADPTRGACGYETGPGGGVAIPSQAPHTGAEFGSAVQRLADVAVVAAFMLGPSHLRVQQARHALASERARLMEAHLAAAAAGGGGGGGHALARRRACPMDTTPVATAAAAGGSSDEVGRGSPPRKRTRADDAPMTSSAQQQRAGSALRSQRRGQLTTSSQPPSEEAQTSRDVGACAAKVAKDMQNGVGMGLVGRSVLEQQSVSDAGGTHGPVSEVVEAREAGGTCGRDSEAVGTRGTSTADVRCAALQLLRDADEYVGEAAAMASTLVRWSAAHEALMGPAEHAPRGPGVELGPPLPPRADRGMLRQLPASWWLVFPHHRRTVGSEDLVANSEDLVTDGEGHQEPDDAQDSD